MLNPMELLGIVLGVFGGFIISVPEWFEKHVFCCWFRNRDQGGWQEGKQVEDSIEVSLDHESP